MIEPLIPPAKRGGNKRTVDVREVVNGLMYILSTGCQWRAIPKDLPPRSTVNDYLRSLGWDGTLDRIHHALYVQCREQAGRRGQPDRRDHRQPERQERGKRGASIDPHGLRCGQEDQGQEAPILVDTQGLLMHAIVHAADIQDRDGGRLLMADAVRAVSVPAASSTPMAATRGRSSDAADKRSCRRSNVEIVKRSDQAKGFVVLPKRWIVERTIAWLNRCRRLAKDWECLNRKALAFLRLASIRLMLRRLCNTA